MRELRVRTPEGGGGYPVRIGAGALGRLGEEVGREVGAFRYAVVADSRVAELHGETALDALRQAGQRAELFTFPAGEWNKTREEWGRLTDGILAAGLGRDGAVVALGGGVTGDLAGFVAATFLRGVPVVQVPTSTLAMMDAAVGGKTGVDTAAGKNLVGAFHHPALVLVDPELAATLPRPQRAAGLAEALKTAAVRDASLLEWLEERAEALLGAEPDTLEEAAFRVLGHKAEVVGTDPAEAGVRAILNFGHTVGHALESLAGFGLLHGEAVAAGMRAEARLGEALGVTEPGTAARLREVLGRCGLGHALETDRAAEEVWEAASRDKKGRRGSPRCVLLARIGEVARAADGAWTHPLAGTVGSDDRTGGRASDEEVAVSRLRHALAPPGGP